MKLINEDNDNESRIRSTGVDLYCHGSKDSRSGVPRCTSSLDLSMRAWILLCKDLIFSR